MRKAIFIWQDSPVFTAFVREGGVYKVKAVHFLKKLQEVLDEEGLDWQVELDDTYADIYELIEKDFDLLIFTPGGKTRFYIPRKWKEKLKNIPKIYLEMLEYHNVDVSKTVNIMSSIKCDE